MSTEKPCWRGSILEIEKNQFQVDLFPNFQNLSSELRLNTALELTPLTGKGFMRFDLNSEELIQDVAKHIEPAGRVMIVRDKYHEPVAFIASALLTINEVKFYLLGGIMVDESLHHSGLGLEILKAELKTTNVGAIVFRTQSKKMLGLARKVANLDEALSISVAKEVYNENLIGLVNKGCYRGGHSLYEDEDKFASQAIDWIDWRHGDGLVVAGFVKPEILT